MSLLRTFHTFSLKLYPSSSLPPLNSSFPHYRKILYHLSHQGSPYKPLSLTIQEAILYSVPLHVGWTKFTLLICLLSFNLQTPNHSNIIGHKKSFSSNRRKCWGVKQNTKFIHRVMGVTCKFFFYIKPHLLSCFSLPPWTTHHSLTPP